LRRFGGAVDLPDRHSREIPVQVLPALGQGLGMGDNQVNLFFAAPGPGK